MSQTDILNVLEESKKPMSYSQIKESLNDNDLNGKIRRTLKKLLEVKEIKCVELDRHQALKYFKCKRVLRIYYLNKSDLIRARRTVAYL